MYFSDELVEDVRTKNDIVDVVGSYVQIKRKGNSHFGLCPFHNEKTPSFSVTGARQMYYCFGCGAGGNVFTFLMEYENLSFPEAVKALAERAGVSLPEVEYSDEARQKEGKRARLLEVSKEAARFYYYQLRSERGKGARDYLQKRGFSEASLHTFGLGFAPQNGDALVRHLRDKGFEDALIREAGLASFHEKQGMSDRFWNRVIFPIQDQNHRVIGLGGRVMGQGEPKYLNSPESMIFDKGRNLYGLGFARTARRGHFIVCEGYTDVIALHQAGFTQAVASLGTAFTAGQAHLLSRYAGEVLLAYDSDSAGEKAALRALAILRECGVAGRVIDLAPLGDPDEFVREKGAEAFAGRIAAAENGFLFELAVLGKGYDQSDPGQRTNFHREIAKRLCNLSDEIERDNYMAAVCKRYGISDDSLRRLVVSYAAQTGLAKPLPRPKSGRQEKGGSDHALRAERALLTWLSDEPELYRQVKAYLTADDFLTPLCHRAAERLFADLEKGRANPAAIISHFGDEGEQREVAAMFNTRPDELRSHAEREKAFNDILRTVKRNSHDSVTARLGGDVAAVGEAIASRKILDELLGNNIKLTDHY